MTLDGPTGIAKCQIHGHKSLNLYDRKILWITSARIIGDKAEWINWDQITKNFKFQAENYSLDVGGPRETCKSLIRKAIS